MNSVSAKKFCTVVAGVPSIADTFDVGLLRIVRMLSNRSHLLDEKEAARGAKK